MNPLPHNSTGRPHNWTKLYTHTHTHTHTHTCDLKEYLVLWSKDLHIQFAMRGVVSDGPGTHDGVLVLEMTRGREVSLLCDITTGVSIGTIVAMVAKMPEVILTEYGQLKGACNDSNYQTSFAQERETSGHGTSEHSRQCPGQSCSWPCAGSRQWLPGP